MARQYHLNYSRRRFTDEDVQRLKRELPAQGTYTYEEVDFSQNELSSTGLRVVLDICKKCPKLRVLKLYRNHIDDVGAKGLADLCGHCPSIEEIHLSHNHITAVGAEALVTAAERARPDNMAPLWLRLEQNEVGDADAVYQELTRHLKVCNRPDEFRCSVRSCCRRMKVHVPFFNLQRARLGAPRAAPPAPSQPQQPSVRRIAPPGPPAAAKAPTAPWCKAPSEASPPAKAAPAAWAAPPAKAAPAPEAPPPTKASPPSAPAAPPTQVSPAPAPAAPTPAPTKAAPPPTKAAPPPAKAAPPPAPEAPPAKSAPPPAPEAPPLKAAPPPGPAAKAAPAVKAAPPAADAGAPPPPPPFKAPPSGALGGASSGAPGPGVGGSSEVDAGSSVSTAAAVEARTPESAAPRRIVPQQLEAEEAAGQFVCVLCGFLVVRLALAKSCQHLFCSPCLTAWGQKQSSKQKSAASIPCPTPGCGSQLRKSDILWTDRPHDTAEVGLKWLQRHRNNLKVRCVHHPALFAHPFGQEAKRVAAETGLECRWVGDLAAYEDHLRKACTVESHLSGRSFDPPQRSVAAPDLATLSPAVPHESSAPQVEVSVATPAAAASPDIAENEDAFHDTAEEPEDQEAFLPEEPVNIRQARYDYTPPDKDTTQLALKARDYVRVEMFHESGWAMGIKLCEGTMQHSGEAGWFPETFLFPPSADAS